MLGGEIHYALYGFEDQNGATYKLLISLHLSVPKNSGLGNRFHDPPPAYSDSLGPAPAKLSTVPANISGY